MNRSRSGGAVIVTRATTASLAGDWAVAPDPMSMITSAARHRTAIHRGRGRIG